MIRGTRIISGREAELFSQVEQVLRHVIVDVYGYEEIRVPSMWETSTFTDKAGEEVRNQMYTFEDKGDRDICLIPEVTGLIQETWNESWSKNRPKPHRVFYTQRCYRYERPQKGRYREFTQLGIEILGGNPEETVEEAKNFLCECLDECDVFYEFADSVERGLSYYIEDGFEASVPALGAQKQIAGGGRYEEGVGWAIGLDRLVLALMEEEGA